MNELESKTSADKIRGRAVAEGHFAGLELTVEEVERVAGGAWPAKIEIGALKAGASEVLYEK